MGTGIAGTLARGRVMAALLLAGLLLGLVAGSAAATLNPWANEATMVDSTNQLGRNTFVYDPGIGHYIDRSQLLGGTLGSYYADRGFDQNFRMWAPDASVPIGDAAPWSGCDENLVHSGPCPVGSLHYDPVVDALMSGSITVIGDANAFIALGCGNFTQGGAAGPTPTVSGVKYEDLNADGQREAGEPGLGGWTMQLLYDGNVVATTTTASDGSYSFRLDADSLPIGAGTYQVQEVQQPGWHASQSATSFVVDLGAGSTAYTGRNFGNYRNATIAGHKFDDGNVDGLWNGSELGLADWTIGLSDGSSTTTAADGSYSFSVRPGTYTLQELLKDGWRQTSPGGDGTRSYTVQSGDVVSDADFGNVCLGGATVDAVDDSTGLPVTGMQLRIEEGTVPGILANDPALPLTGDTPATFGDLLPGTYRITAFLPDGIYTDDPDVALVDGRFAIVKTIAVQECRSTQVHLHLVSGSTPGKVTGGDLTLDGGRQTGGFELMTNSGGLRGTLQYDDHATPLTLHTSEIDNLQILSPQEAIAWGHVTVAGASVQFRLHLVDAGEPGTADRYELWLANGYRAGFDGPLSGGNVQIHT